MDALSSMGRASAPLKSRAKLVLVLSPERSGSTLLSVLLGAHSRVIAPPELHLFRFATFDEWLERYPPAFRSLCSAFAMVGGPPSEVEVERRFRGRSVEEVYEELLALCGPEGWLLDKTPAYARSSTALERSESFRPQFVWLVRHPLGVAQSRMERVFERRRGKEALGARLKYPFFVLRRAVRRWSGKELAGELARWREAHERIERFLEGLDEPRHVRVHYESLVRQPKSVLLEICAHLGLDLEPGMLDPRGHMPEGLAWGVGDQKIARHASIDPSMGDRWRRYFGEHQLDPLTRRLMERLYAGEPSRRASASR